MIKLNLSELCKSKKKIENKLMAKSSKFQTAVKKGSLLFSNQYNLNKQYSV